jgi:hydrogenase-1 operon protein HyaF
MPKDMDTYRPPVLPEPEDVVGLDQAREVLLQVLALLAQGHSGQVSLNGLPARDVALLNQVLGEGEASAVLQLDETALVVKVQESVLTGVWRLVTERAGTVVDDAIEVGPVPALVRAVAAEDVWEHAPQWVGTLPPNVQNAPMLIEEIRDQASRWVPGQLPHVVNLTLLPVTVEDIGFLDHHLGTGRVLMLSRGYGNCRISNTRVPHCWRVVYYNSMDTVILNTVEVVDMPEVALAAPEDLADSHERLQQVLAWLESA